YIYAEAAGYPMELVSPGVTMLPGQSLHFDANLNPGVVIHGDVYSKHQVGDQPWLDNSFIEIELYDQPTNNHLPDPRANLVSWSPLPCIAGGQESYVGGPSAATPWFYQVATGPGSPLSNGASQKQTQDPQGVGPPQHWFVKGGS